MTNPNKKNTQAKVNTVEIPEAELANLVSCLGKLFSMHNNLIGYYEEESALKKHHRAYLHVRDEAEQVIRNDIEEMGNMLTSIGGFLVSGKSPLVDNEVPFACEVTPIPTCKCAECKRDVEDDEDDDPCVIMKLDDLYAMQKDMIDLTDAIDLMAKYYVATKYQAPVNKQKYDDTVHNAKALAEEVFTRWENSTIEEIK